MFIIYDLIYVLVAILSLPYLIVRLAKNPRYCEGFRMRLGILPDEFTKKLLSKRVIWIHAVSVGEVMASKTLLDNLREKFPDHRLIISTVTQTGNRIAKTVVRQEDIVIYFPFDLSFITQSLIKKISPALFLMIETEIWPNFITAASKGDVPVVLVNGRISPKSFSRYRKIKFLLKGVLEKIELFLMQTEGDRKRIVSLGAPPDKVKVTGNMKFDQASLAEVSEEEIAKLKDLLNISGDDSLFVAGSTHKGEEEILLRAYQHLKRQYQNLKLLLAPRHPQRSLQVERLVKKYGFVPVRVSQLVDNKPSTIDPSAPLRAGDKRIFILDTIGQLRSIYSLATLVFVGGSLVPHGGQNPLEPACLAKPILFGPHLFNFQAIANALLQRKAAVLVEDGQDLESRSSELLKDSSRRENLGRLAKETIGLSLGATKRNIDLIKEIFDPVRSRR